jgi:hypothetical protein
VPVWQGAGVIVPLVLAALPELLKVISPLIVALVHKQAPVIEAQQGPGTGPVKIADLNVFVMAALVKAHAAGEITGDLPSPELLLKARAKCVNICQQYARPFWSSITRSAIPR